MYGGPGRRARGCLRVADPWGRGLVGQARSPLVPGESVCRKMLLVWPGQRLCKASEEFSTVGKGEVRGERLQRKPGKSRDIVGRAGLAVDDVPEVVDVQGVVSLIPMTVVVDQDGEWLRVERNLQASFLFHLAA